MNPVSRQLEDNLFHIMQFPKLFLRAGSKRRLSEKVLLLGTIGRKTGKMRFTPLQYEYYRNSYFIGSMRGKKADWVKNIQKNNRVYLQITKEKRFLGIATVIEKSEIILSFLKLRIARNPTMIPIILFIAGVKDFNNPESLKTYSKKITLVKITNLKQYAS